MVLKRINGSVLLGEKLQPAEIFLVSGQETGWLGLRVSEGREKREKITGSYNPQFNFNL